MTAVLEVRGARYAVRVRSTPSTEPHRLTCSATRNNAPVRHELLDLSPADPQ